MKRFILFVAALLMMVSAQGLAHAGHRTRRRAVQQEPDQRVMGVVHKIEHTMKVTRYSHATRIVPSEGRYEFDCSVMVAWVLRRSTPQAQSEVELGGRLNRPLARDYLHYFQSIAQRRRTHWESVAHVATAQAGDLIAWTFPSWVRTAMTGHVAILVRRPTLVRGMRNVYSVRIADAASVAHDNDTRLRPSRSGFGYGDILVRVNQAGEPIAYRPNTRPGTGFIQTQIAVARPRS